MPAFVSHALPTLRPSHTRRPATTSLSPAAPAAFLSRRALPSASSRPHTSTTTNDNNNNVAAAAAPTMNALSPLARALSVAFAATLLAIGPADSALAARSGARVGGSNFRAPAAPTQSYSQPQGYGGGGYGYGGGGGMFFGPSMMFSPMLMPLGVVGGGLGGFGTLMLVGTGAALAYRAVSDRAEEAQFEKAVNPDTAVVTCKVALLASARQLQLDLDMVARSADTSTMRGLRYVLEEAVLALLRNPDRWVYGSVDSAVAPLDKSEDAFNRRCMEERLKLTEETLTNVAGNRKESVESSPVDPAAPPAEYIVVSLVCAAADPDLASEIPKEITSAADLNRALGMLGGVSADGLQGIEIIWAPQSLNDTLTEQEMLQDHPELRRI